MPDKPDTVNVIVVFLIKRTETDITSQPNKTKNVCFAAYKY